MIFIQELQTTKELSTSNLQYNEQYYWYFYFRYEDETERHWGSNIPVNCETENIDYLNDQRGKREDYTSRCIFPYEYKGKTYYECFLGLFGDDDYNYWCPTELDYDNQPYNWGRCGENCPSSDFRIGDNVQNYTEVIFPKFASELKEYFPNLLETQ